MSIHPPFALYSHGVEVPGGTRLVFCSGQLGIGSDRVIPPDVAAQSRLCFEAIAAVLGEASMSLADIIRLNAYVTDRKHLKTYMAIRDQYVGHSPPASTLMIVSGFAREEFMVEIEAVAGRQDR